MKIFNKTILTTGVLAMAAFAVVAQEYNHGDHNDNSYTYATNSIETIDCGSSSLATCINPANIESWAKTRCEQIKNIGGAIPWGVPYWHSAQSYAVRPVSAQDGNNGVGSFDYTIDVIYSCSALYHPASVSKF